MSEFNDFRIVLTRNIQAPGTWDVLLEECPVPALCGQKGSMQPNIPKQHLVRLRSQHGWPNVAELTTIGKEVWRSLMTTNLESAFHSGLAVSQGQNRGMRLVISMVGEDAELDVPGHIRLQELPLEALYCDSLQFLAPNLTTPISRSLKFKPDREPQHVALPLRMLIVVAAPTDKPASQMQEEKDIILQALAPIEKDQIRNKVTGLSGAIEIEFCEPPTRPELANRLLKGFQILHFVGHGAFDIVGDDPSPRPHLCFEKPDRTSNPVDAKTLGVLLQNSGVKLVVMTACASAVPAFQNLSPDDIQKNIGPFDGIAQTLVAGESGVNAAVAMQFDLESDAAVTFSKTFYTQLLSHDCRLDEVVTICRKAIIAEKNVGHRAWLTPVVYWRCKGGTLFEISPLIKRGDPQTEKELLEIDTMLGVFLKHITEAMALPPGQRQAAAPLVEAWQQEVQDLQHQRGQLLGETLRLFGGAVKSGDTIQCRLKFRLRTPGQIGNVSVRINYPEDKVVYRAVGAGAQTPNNVPFVQNQVPGELKLLLENASQSAQWTPDEHELAVLTFQVKAGVTDPLVELRLMEGNVQRDGSNTPCETLSAVLFVS